MHDEQPFNTKYQRGFNEGYIIAKYMPELSDQVAKVTSEDPRIEGFLDGRNEFILEKAKDRLPSWLKKDVTKKEVTNKLPPKDDKEIEKE